MIISKLKDKKVILEKLAGDNKIFVVGCSECAATCRCGGEEEVKNISEFLLQNGKQISGQAVIESPCIEAKTKMELLKNTKILQDADSILVLSCGIGVQVISQCLRKSKKVIPGTDTIFAGAVFGKTDDFKEFCSLCGECIVDKTLGICPYTRCSKGILNGPCGGSKNGKCEVDKEKDCAWILIYKKFKDLSRENELLEIMPPKDFSKKNKPAGLKL